MAKRPEFHGSDVVWSVAEKRGKLKKMEEGRPKVLGMKCQWGSGVRMLDVRTCCTRSMQRQLSCPARSKQLQHSQCIGPAGHKSSKVDPWDRPDPNPFRLSCYSPVMRYEQIADRNRCYVTASELPGFSLEAFSSRASRRLIKLSTPFISWSFVSS